MTRYVVERKKLKDNRIYLDDNDVYIYENMRLTINMAITYHLIN